MPVQDRPGLGHSVQFGSLDLNPLALLLEENPHVPVTEIVGQDEDDVGLLSLCNQRGGPQDEEHPPSP